jgi:hypothetical protein
LLSNQSAADPVFRQSTIFSKAFESACDGGIAETSELQLQVWRQLFSRRIRRVAFATLAMNLLLLLAGCGGGGGSASTPSSPIPRHSVTISWNASVTPNVVGYLVFRRPVNDSNYVLLNTSATPSLTYVDLTVQGGEDVMYAVAAVHSDMTPSVPSQEVEVIVPQ